MRIIKVEANDLGGHANQTSSTLTVCPDGWAVIPDGIEIPDTFPFVDIVVEDGVVTEMTAGVMPEPTPVEPTDTEILDALLGVTENE